MFQRIALSLVALSAVFLLACGDEVGMQPDHSSSAAVSQSDDVIDLQSDLLSSDAHFLSTLSEAQIEALTTNFVTAQLPDSCAIYLGASMEEAQWKSEHGADPAAVQYTHAGSNCADLLLLANQRYPNRAFARYVRQRWIAAGFFEDDNPYTVGADGIGTSPSCPAGLTLKK